MRREWNGYSDSGILFRVDKCIKKLNKQRVNIKNKIKSLGRCKVGNTKILVNFQVVCRVTCAFEDGVKLCWRTLQLTSIIQIKDNILFYKVWIL